MGKVNEYASGRADGLQMALKLGRRGLGFELKESYYKQAKSNLEIALNEPCMDCPVGQMSIEDFLDVNHRQIGIADFQDVLP